MAWFWNSGYGRTFCLLAIAVCGIYARAVNMKEFDLDLSESLRFFFIPCVCFARAGIGFVAPMAERVSHSFGAGCSSIACARFVGKRANISFARVVPFKFPHHFKELENQEGAGLEMCVIEAVDVESRRFDQLWCRYWEMFEGMFLLATRPRDGRQRACNPRMV